MGWKEKKATGERSSIIHVTLQLLRSCQNGIQPRKQTPRNRDTDPENIETRELFLLLGNGQSQEVNMADSVGPDSHRLKLSE